ncbi:MAG: hypothetical protein LAN71_04075 [Acidobacteriia bacterium]|nr:hypothetical protein [Terriglobia bacterium]
MADRSRVIGTRKVPIDAHTGKPYPSGKFTSEQMGTATFEEAMACFAAHKDLTGIGFRFKKSDPYTGVDLDNCRDPETEDLLDWAKEIVQQFGTYTEVSPSGMGVKLIARGKIQKAVSQTDGVEMYDHGRFFALTGRGVNGSAIANAQEPLDYWFAMLTKGEDGTEKEKTGKHVDARPGGARIPSGQHDVFLTRIAGKVRRDGLEEAALENALIEVCEKRCEDFGSDYREMCKKIARSISKYEPAPEEISVEAAAEISTTGRNILLTQNLNDTGNSERLLAVHGENLLYVSPWKDWLGWDWNRWLKDEKDKIRALTRYAMKQFGKEAFDAGNRTLIDFAKYSLNTKAISNAINEARDQRALLPTELDHNRDLLNFQNGTLNLRTGELRPHDRADHITKLIHCPHNRDAHCPTITKFLMEAVGEEQYSLLLRALGYTLTGHVSEKCIFVCWGPTNTGKTTLLNLLSEFFFKEYSTLIMADSLMQSIRQDSNTLSDLADLCGARFAQTSETRENQRLDEATLKRITPGQGLIRAVRKYELPFTFSPTHKIWVDTNHAIVATATGDDVWGRIIPFEFGPRIPDEKIDRTLPARLRAEMEGFFALVCEEAKAWYEQGLGALPEKIIDTRKNWKNNADRVRRFITECCELDKDQLIKNREIAPRLLYQGYNLWDREGGERPMTETMFFLKLKEIMGEFEITKDGRVYKGIDLSQVAHAHVFAMSGTRK